MNDADYMARALFHAARGLGRTRPNPVVGAVVVAAQEAVQVEAMEQERLGTTPAVSQHARSVEVPSLQVG